LKAEEEIYRGFLSKSLAEKIKIDIKEEN